MLQIYNTLTGQKAKFIPITPGKVNLYVCGMTVYDYCHVGHARVMVVFDVIVRYLRVLGYEVTYIRNITDIDDKIIKRANENGETIQALTERFIQFMNEDAAALGIIRPDQEPRATQHIDQIIHLIKRLINNGHAYQATNGDVYYAVNTFNDYGKLSGKKIDELRAGARVEIAEAKRDPLDFVLWKIAKANEPAWDSPWGLGRPGWHIECSAMSTHCLGNHFDIHGGGMDLQFPHHENEIAQSEGATGEPFANIWVHNGFVRVDDEKMSKSLGNFFTLREVMADYHPEEIRYFIISSHYRSSLNYSKTNLDIARNALKRMYLALRGHPESQATLDETYLLSFQAAMDDDFNTPEALPVMFEVVNELNKIRSTDAIREAQLVATLRLFGNVLGLLQCKPEDYLQGQTAGSAGLSSEQIEEYIEQRHAARKNKNWSESDRIRDLLSEQGILLEDAAGKTTWRRK